MGQRDHNDKEDGDDVCYLLGAQSRPDVQTGEDGGSGGIKVAAFGGVRRDGRLRDRWDQTEI
jgi:hypothetical protein